MVLQVFIGAIFAVKSDVIGARARDTHDAVASILAIGAAAAGGAANGSGAEGEAGNQAAGEAGNQVAQEGYRQTAVNSAFTLENQLISGSSAIISNGFKYDEDGNIEGYDLSGERADAALRQYAVSTVASAVSSEIGNGLDKNNNVYLNRFLTNGSSKITSSLLSSYANPGQRLSGASALGSGLAEAVSLGLGVFGPDLEKRLKDEKAKQLLEAVRTANKNGQNNNAKDALLGSAIAAARREEGHIIAEEYMKEGGDFEKHTESRTNEYIRELAAKGVDVSELVQRVNAYRESIKGNVLAEIQAKYGKTSNEYRDALEDLKPGIEFVPGMGHVIAGSTGTPGSMQSSMLYQGRQYATQWTDTQHTLNTMIAEADLITPKMYSDSVRNASYMQMAGGVGMFVGGVAMTAQGVALSATGAGAIIGVPMIIAGLAAASMSMPMMGFGMTNYIQSNRGEKYVGTPATAVASYWGEDASRYAGKAETGLMVASNLYAGGLAARAALPGLTSSLSSIGLAQVGTKAGQFALTAGVNGTLNVAGSLVFDPNMSAQNAALTFGVGALGGAWGKGVEMAGLKTFENAMITGGGLATIDVGYQMYTNDGNVNLLQTGFKFGLGVSGVYFGNDIGLNLSTKSDWVRYLATDTVPAGVSSLYGLSLDLISQKYKDDYTVNMRGYLK